MRNDDQINTRRDTLKKIVKGAGFIGLGGFVWGGFVEDVKAVEFALRPPGALEAEDFIKACVKCGTCVEACPYDTLKIAEPGDNKSIGNPFFEPRIVPCYMCPDVPCVPVCPSGALSEEKLFLDSEDASEKTMDINVARMGIAYIDTESCLAFWGIQCDACYRACPLIGEAITLDMQRNERTGKHALLKPFIHNDVCTGCGLCEHACVTEKPAIFILPRDKATGEVGEHYIKGWEKQDEKRLKDLKEKKSEENIDKSVEDYLNDWEALIDD